METVFPGTIIGQKWMGTMLNHKIVDIIFIHCSASFYWRLIVRLFPFNKAALLFLLDKNKGNIALFIPFMLPVDKFFPDKFSV